MIMKVDISKQLNKNILSYIQSNDVLIARLFENADNRWKFVYKVCIDNACCSCIPQEIVGVWLLTHALDTWDHFIKSS